MDGVIEGPFVAGGPTFRSSVHYGWQNENDVAELLVVNQLVEERRKEAAIAGQSPPKLRVLTVIGGADTTLTLLTQADAIECVHAVDMNDSQLALLHLKRAAAATCPGGAEGVCRFLGLGDEEDPASQSAELAEERKKTYQEYVRPYLEPKYQEFWDANLEPSIASGACAATAASRLYGTIRATLRSRGFTEEDIFRGKLAKQVQEMDEKGDQEGFAKLRRSLLECVPFSIIDYAHDYRGQPFWPAMQQTIGPQFGPMMVDSLFYWWRKEAAYGKFGDLMRNNVVMSQSFAGKIDPSKAYQWLRSDLLEAFQEGRTATLHVHQGDFFETAKRLCAESGQKFDLITTSNVADRSPIEIFRPCLKELASCLKPGGYILSRRFGGHQDQLFEGILAIPSDLNKELLLKAEAMNGLPFSQTAGVLQ